MDRPQVPPAARQPESGAPRVSPSSTAAATGGAPDPGRALDRGVKLVQRRFDMIGEKARYFLPVQRCPCCCDRGCWRSLPHWLRRRAGGSRAPPISILGIRSAAATPMARSGARVNALCALPRAREAAPSAVDQVKNKSAAVGFANRPIATARIEAPESSRCAGMFEASCSFPFDAIGESAGHLARWRPSR
jgi:hypothetical protein